jgi:hypothetical protein
MLLLIASIFGMVLGTAFFIVVFMLGVWCFIEFAIRGASAFIRWLRDKMSR